jgi:hypothetical protein
MSLATSFEPLGSSQFGFAQAAHLLNRAGFGGNHAQIAALQKMGLIHAVDYLVDYESVDPGAFKLPDYDPDIMHPTTARERLERQQARKDNDFRERIQAERNYRKQLDAEQIDRMENWWLQTMITTPRPLEEKLTLLWHGHFASSQRTVDDSYLMLQQNQLFRKHASDSFATLALGIVRDPAMIKYLNNDTNRKAHPNENLARELMELFTLGQGHYTEDDIKQGARALTGATYRDNDYNFSNRNFDQGDKTILGQTGPWNAEAFVRIILNRPDCPKWVASKLYRHFVGDLDDGFTPDAQSNVNTIARLLVDSRYRLKPVLKAIFRSQMFYSDAVVGNLIKSPAQMVVGAVRSLDAPVNDIALLQDALGLMGQKLFNPPSVAGWYGGRSWINTSTLFIRQNLGTYIITGKLPFKDGWSEQKITLDPSTLLAGLEHPTAGDVVDHLLATLCTAKLSSSRRQELVNFLAGRKSPTDHDALIGLLLLITALPEYQLC